MAAFWPHSTWCPRLCQVLYCLHCTKSERIASERRAPLPANLTPDPYTMFVMRLRPISVN